MEDLTEEQMRRALFGTDVGSKQSVGPRSNGGQKIPRARLRVSLRVGNEFEGKMFDLVHDVNTLSTLLAEQEAIMVARKKYRFIEVVSVQKYSS